MTGLRLERRVGKMLDLREIKRRRAMFSGQLSTKDIDRLVAEIEKQNAGLYEIAMVLDFIANMEGQEGMTDAKFAESTLALVHTLLGHER